MKLSSWPVALRIARREARRAKGRSALVIALIALPVLALTFAAASYDMFRLTPQEKANRLLGGADARINWAAAGPVEQDPAGEGFSSQDPRRTDIVGAKDLLAVLPAGSAVTPFREGTVELRTAGGVGELKAYGIDVTNPIVADIVTLGRGHAPANRDEIALTEQAAERLGADVGNVVPNADRTASWTVTGIVEFPGELSEKVVFWPDGIPAGSRSAMNQWLWDAPAPVDWAHVQRLNQHGLVVVSREVLLDPPKLDPSGVDNGAPISARAFAGGWVLIGLALLEVVLLAGPAFAVGARRRQRELALVAANGGTPAHLRRIVLADGVVLGGLGAAAGLLLGVATAFAFRPLVETHLAHERAGGYRAFPLALLAIAGLAVGTGVLAALVPAFTAARGDVIAALTGRRGVRRSRKRWLFLGLALAGAGAATTAAGAWWISSQVVLAGLVLVELGLVLCTPALVGLVGRLGRVLPLAPRIALRDAARNRAAAASAIAAVMAAVAGSVAIGVVRTTDQARADAQYREALPPGHAIVINDPTYLPGTEPKSRVPMESVVAAVRGTLPATEIVTVAQVACRDGAVPRRGSCYLNPRMPQDRQCPYRSDSGEVLSRAQQRAANTDPRCEREDGASSPASFNSVVSGPAAVTALTDASGGDLAKARETLKAGGVLVNDARYVVGGTVVLEVFDVDTTGPGKSGKQAQARTLTVPGYAPTTGTPLSTDVFSPAAVRAAKLGQRPYGIVVATDRMPTQAEQDRLRSVLRGLDEEMYAAVEPGRPQRGNDPTLLILAAVAGFITLGAAGVATGLAAADGRADLATLAAVGASPGIRRRLSLSQSGIIAGLGTALGLIAGLGASTAVLSGYNQAATYQWPSAPPYPITVSWQTLAVTVVVPLVAMLGAGLLTRSRLNIERRRLT